MIGGRVSIILDVGPVWHVPGLGALGAAASRVGVPLWAGAARAADDSSYLILNIDIFMCVLKKSCSVQ